jgi:hypothetical protein
MKSGSGGLRLVPKDRVKGKSYLERAKEAIGNKLKSLFAVVDDQEKGSIDFALLICCLPPEVVAMLRKIERISALTKSDDFQFEEIGLSGSGGVCHRIIYRSKYIFIVKKIDLTFFADRDYLRLEREINIQSSLSHQRIPQLYHSFFDNNAFYLVMQYGGEDICDQLIEDREDIINVCSSSSRQQLKKTNKYIDGITIVGNPILSSYQPDHTQRFKTPEYSSAPE